MRNGRVGRTAAIGALSALGMAASAQAAPGTITALTDGASLVTVRADKPNKAVGEVAITGLAPGESIVGIDRRPRGGSLYGVITAPMQQAKVATISETGEIGNVKPLFVVTGTPPAPTGATIVLTGGSFGLDFNPTVDRLRLVSDAEENLRINVDTGGTFVDGKLNPGDPAVIGAAYTNNDDDAVVPAGTPVPAGFTGTALYDIDTATDTLALQSPPNAGTLVTIGSLGTVVGDPVGFDVYSDVATNAQDGTKLSAVSNEPYASFAESNGTEKLYTVNLSSGAATQVGPFGRSDIADIAVPIDTTP